MTEASKDKYYVPSSTKWPLIASIGLSLSALGAGMYINPNLLSSSPYVLFIGLSIVLFVIIGWFREVILESQAGMYNDQVERSFRWGMIWFIISEVFFFAAFFGSLFYLRLWSVPLLGGEYYPITNILLWPNFVAEWPLLVNPDMYKLGGEDIIDPWGLPFINTLILLTSGATLTWAHWALKLEKRRQLVIGLLFTVILGILFLYLQALEYVEAYVDLDLTLDSGVYASTFFMLTGFHGFHVTLGTIMLIVIMIRCMIGHFKPKHHFGFEAVAWYWHFVDFVWLFLFVFVYWL